MADTGSTLAASGANTAASGAATILSTTFSGSRMSANAQVFSPQEGNTDTGNNWIVSSIPAGGSSDGNNLHNINLE